VPVARLEDILRESVPAGQGIDFISVDAEGFDLQVLQSNDWQAYRPKCVLAEAHNASIEQVMQGDIYRFMKERDYELFAKTVNTLVFRECRRP
jgi:hypothetical protein